MSKPRRSLLHHPRNLGNAHVSNFPRCWWQIFRTLACRASEPAAAIKLTSHKGH